MKEARRYGQLGLLFLAGAITELRVHPGFDVEINGQPFCRYTADFAYLDAAGRQVVEEVKSTGTRRDPAYRLRRKAAELYHGMKVIEHVI